jgi:molybdopterin-guanine dinucleotide biosynthesis protein A
MQASGFVLAGGASKRMGQDKALLPYRGITLVQHVANTVHDAVGSAVLIGDPNRLGHLGIPVFPDQLPSCGPAGGIYTALQITKTDWNLVVACDMPAVSADVLRQLLDRAEMSERPCVAATGPDGQPEPLCAVYHRHCLPALERAIQRKRLKMRDFLVELGAGLMPVPPAALANVNTPAEWSQFDGGAI